jgi:hypothetical protein
MEQTLHIFRKDVRRFRYELCVVAALTGAFAWSHIAADMPVQQDPQQMNGVAMLAGVTSFFLVLAWWFVISQLIHEESLAGDRQFWVTRPYVWRQLLAAKILFVIAFVNLPLLAAQVAILMAAGYRPLTGIPQLLWMQAAATAAFLVPVMALGTVTRNLAQFVLSILGGLLFWYMALMALKMSNAPQGVIFIGYTRGAWPSAAVAVCVACAGAMLTIAWQFSRHSTKASICAGLCTFFVASAVTYGLPMRLGNAIRSTVFHQRETEAVSVFVPPFPPSYGLYSNGAHLNIHLLYMLNRVPLGELVLPEMLNVAVETASGRRWSSGWEAASSGVVPTHAEQGSQISYSQELFVPRGFYRSIQGAAVIVHGSMLLSVWRQGSVPLAPGQTTPIPGGGFCTVSPAETQWKIFCSSPFRPPFDLTSGSNFDFSRNPAGLERHDWIQLVSFPDWPFPNFALSPVFTERSASTVGAEVSLVRESPHAWIERDFTARVRMPAER